MSVLTSIKLPKHLQAIKKKLGLTLIKFEDATIDLEPFIRMHSFESSQFIVHSILKHYIDVSRLFFLCLFEDSFSISVKIIEL